MLAPTLSANSSNRRRVLPPDIKVPNVWFGQETHSRKPANPEQLSVLDIGRLRRFLMGTRIRFVYRLTENFHGAFVRLVCAGNNFN